MDELVAWLRGVLDEAERRARTMIDLDWPREVWVAPADMQGWREGEFAGSVSVHEYAPKRYARMNAGDWAMGDKRIDHGWVVHETAQEVWSEDVGRSLLARVEAERAILRFHSGAHECSSWNYGEIDNCCYINEFETCSTVRLLAYGYRYTADGYNPTWTPEGVQVTE